ncbi:MAG: MmcQ/YjbR family DNA-binding protein [Balneolaceae bacterium]|nr:MmcQ/YjbR family DNA-binding protein [Balneolaceae bacterium]
MNIEEFREICSSFEGVTEGFPFDDNTLAYKVMGKIFALTDVEEFDDIILKCDPVKAATLRDLYPEVQPGYHMNKRHWNSVDPHGYLSDVLIKEWIKDSYDLVVESLPRKDQRKVEKMIEKRKKKEKKEKEKQKNSEEE